MESATGILAAFSNGELKPEETITVEIVFSTIGRSAVIQITPIKLKRKWALAARFDDTFPTMAARFAVIDRKSVVFGKSVDMGGGRII